MKILDSKIESIDKKITDWKAKYGLSILRISIGVVFFWFGSLKFFEGLSPAQDLAINTISKLTFGILGDKTIIYLLASWEVAIGLGLIFNRLLRLTLLLLFLQMAGTFMPVIMFPQDVFNIFPYSLTLEGQYIIKNIVIVSAGIVLGATVRGGKLVSLSSDYNYRGAKGSIINK